MTRRFRAPVVLALASLSLGACTETKELGITVTFNPPTDRDRARLVEVTVRAGTCLDPGDIVYEADVVLPAGTSTAGPSDGVGSGPHAFSARAIAPDCTLVGEECVDRDLPTSEAAVNIPIGGGGGGTICLPTEECTGSGRCVRTSIPDASVMCTSDGECGGGTCHDNVCCFGCWDGTACRDGTTGSACGVSGDACDVCGPGNQCVGSLCVPSSTESTFDLSANATFLRHESGVYYAGTNADYQHDGDIANVPSGTSGLGGFTGSLRFADIGATQFNACGITEEGELWCWGRQPDDTRIRTPYRVADVLSFTAIDGGDGHFCAIDDSSRLYCWGANTEGQLGTGAVGGSQSAPVPVGGTDTWRTVASLGAHTCAIRSDGALFCWGDNENGQLGMGDMVDSGMIRRVGTESDWIHVSPGVKHTCGIRGVGVTGSLWCWGRNGSGELGIGIMMDMSPHPMPVQVGTDTTWSAISSGQYHTCGINDGSAQCWGANIWGELGTGNMTTLFAPTATVLGGPYSSIAASWRFTCGVSGNAFFCWGNAAPGGFLVEAPPGSVHSTPIELELFPPP